MLRADNCDRPKLSSKVIKELQKSKYWRGQSTRKLSKLKVKDKCIQVNISQIYICICQSHLVYQHLKVATTSYRELTEKKNQFARKYRHLTESNWENFVFSDEPPNHLFYEQNRHNDVIWGSQEEKVPFVRKVKKSAYMYMYVNIWG